MCVSVLAAGRGSNSALVASIRCILKDCQTSYASACLPCSSSDVHHKHPISPETFVLFHMEQTGISMLCCAINVRILPSKHTWDPQFVQPKLKLCTACCLLDRPFHPTIRLSAYQSELQAIIDLTPQAAHRPEVQRLNQKYHSQHFSPLHILQLYISMLCCLMKLGQPSNFLATRA